MTDQCEVTVIFCNDSPQFAFVGSTATDETVKDKIEELAEAHFHRNGYATATFSHRDTVIKYDEYRRLVYWHSKVIEGIQ